jgi:subtilisin family serine protease
MTNAASPSVALAFFFSFSISSLSHAQISSALNQKSPDAAPIVALADRDGHVPIIVEFASPVPLNQIKPDANVLAPLKAQIAAIQDALIGHHFDSAANPRGGQGFERSITRFDITPMFAVVVNKVELEVLAADPRVLRIHQNKLGRTTLIDSVPLIGMTGASGAYAQGATGQRYAVAVVDTGVQANHEFLTGKVVSEACFSNGVAGAGRVTLCPNGTNSQTGAGAADSATANCINGTTNMCQHGSHVAGIAAGNNTSLGTGEPPNGVAKFAEIVAVQVFTRRNNDSDCGGTGTAPCIRYWTSDVMLGLNWIFQNALNLPNQVTLASVNMSFGEGTPMAAYCDTHVLKSALDNLRSAGVAPVVAAGNESATNGVSAPGCISTAVTVSSTTKADVISSFSDMGVQVDLLAPGSSIQSSVPVVPASTTTYASFSGTSMAAPHVAGAFAALRSACPGLPNPVVDFIEGALINTGISVTDTRSGGSFSRTRIRVDLAYQNLKTAFPSQCSPTLTVLPATGMTFSGLQGGPFASGNSGYVLNVTRDTANYSIAITGSPTPTWLSAEPSTGTVSVGSDTDIIVSTTLAANSLAPGTYNATLNFANTTNTFGNTTRNVSLIVVRRSPHDFDGSGKSDILWRQNGGAAAAWLMNNVQVAQAPGFGIVPTNWQIVGQRDFDGNGASDILWRDSNTGTVAIWFLISGAQVSSTGVVGTVPTAWTIVGTGDANGDRKGDLLWRNTSTGAVAIWLMSGAQVAQSAGLATVPTNWSIVGHADFNGDGKADILWRDTTSGTLAIWFLNGTQVASSASVATVPLTWQVVATGDFNGDGKADILWRDSSGAVALWQMNGAQVAQSGGLGTVPTNWSIVETGDFNGDGFADILWRDTAAGTVAIWFPQVSSNATVATVPIDWVIQSLNVN